MLTLGQVFSNSILKRMWLQSWFHLENLYIQLSLCLLINKFIIFSQKIYYLYVRNQLILMST